VLLCIGGGLAAAQDISSPVNVTVDTDKVVNILAPRAFGIGTAVYDNLMQDGPIVGLLHNDGIYTLRYPGGGYADLYHWSTNTLNAWRKTGKSGYLAKNTDFGSFVKLVDRLGGTAVITVNYGSNLEGNGPGEPEEAAAWVAYANGRPGDERPIGKSASGRDWRTVGYWAAMRASAPLAKDDGYNFLRIRHPQGLNIKYWEIGNEIFGNGYYGKDNGGFENDLHAAYTAVDADNVKARAHNPELSPMTYGKGVTAFSQAMKAVDPRISIGAVLGTPPGDDSWSNDWNSNVLRACAPAIDFVVIHWYTGDYAPPDYKELDLASFLAKPYVELPLMIKELLQQFHDDAGGKPLQLAITELNSRPYAKVTDPLAWGLFAADAYASLAEDGAVNIDWLELHNSSFIGPTDETLQPAYFGIQMAHHLLNMRDSFVAATSSNSLLSAHASKRADGSVGLLLINKDPKDTATVRVRIEGAMLAATGMRFDWGKGAPPHGTEVQSAKMENAGNRFSLTVPPYTATEVTLLQVK
jgi:hypothetical protein